MTGRPGFRVDVARSLEEVELLKRTWNAVPWTGEQAEHAYFVAAAAMKSDMARPFAILVSRADEPVAALAGRVETRRLDTNIGYLRIYRPTVRILQVVPGGVVATDDESIAPLVDVVAATLAGGDAEALAVPALPVGTQLFTTFAGLGGPLERQRFVPTWTRRRLVLPGSFDEFLASRSRKIRAGIRYDAKKLLAALGDELSVEIYRDASSLEKIVQDVESIARTTYQRALGAGFADTPDQRALARIALEHGWARAYVLYHRLSPIAYWLCSIHRDTVSLRTTGYLPEYARYRAGIYLLMRVVEDACADPALRLLDFGPGRSDYKRHFSSDGYEERNLVVFAPTFRARRINLLRTAILGTASVTRRTLDSSGLTERLKAAWRARLRKTIR